MLQFLKNKFFEREIYKLELLKEALDYETEATHKSLNKREDKLIKKEYDHKIKVDAWDVLKQQKLEDILREQIKENETVLKNIVDFDYIINAYKQVKTSDTIIQYHNKKLNVNWNFFRKMITILCNEERNYIINEGKIRDRQSKRSSNSIEDILLQLPINNRMQEKYINPFEQKWENRYYNRLFDIDLTETNITPICNNYLEGLEWTIKYYSGVCPDWKWKYNYNYPPLLTDLIKNVPCFSTIFIENNDHQPVHKFVQLAYVLPIGKLDLLPTHIKNTLINYYSHWYPDSYDIEWSYCKYFWESHLNLPDIEINILEELIKNIIK